MILLLDLSLVIIELLATYFLCKCYLTQKRFTDIVLAGYIWIIGEVAAIILLYIIRSYLGDRLEFGTFYMILNILTYLLLMYTFIELFFEGRRFLKLSLVITMMIFMFFIEYFIYFVIEKLFHLNYFMESGSILYYCGSFGAKLIEVAIMVLYQNAMASYKFPMKERRISILQTLLQSSIPALTAVFFLIYPIFEMDQGTVNDIYYFYVILIFALINTIHFIVFELFQKVSHENYENQLAAREYQLRERYYKHIETCQEEIRIIRHDLKNQLIGLGVTGDIDNLKSEVKEMVHELDDKERAVFTRNQGIDMLLWAKQKYANDHDINCEFEIKVPEQMNFTPRDLHTLIGNIIDNAIEACMKCDQGSFLKFKLFYYNHALFLKSINSTDGKVRGLFTRKLDKVNHGLGIKSIQTVVDKYFGNMEYEIKDRIFVVELTLWEPDIK